MKNSNALYVCHALNILCDCLGIQTAEPNAMWFPIIGAIYAGSFDGEHVGIRFVFRNRFDCCFLRGEVDHTPDGPGGKKRHAYGQQKKALQTTTVSTRCSLGIHSGKGGYSGKLGHLGCHFSSSGQTTLQAPQIAASSHLPFSRNKATPG
jgi:hypothetical protein